MYRWRGHLQELPTSQRSFKREKTVERRLHGFRKRHEFRSQHAAQAHPFVCQDLRIDIHITPQLCRCSAAIGINFLERRAPLSFHNVR